MGSGILHPEPTKPFKRKALDLLEQQDIKRHRPDSKVFDWLSRVPDRAATTSPPLVKPRRRRSGALSDSHLLQDLPSPRIAPQSPGSMAHGSMPPPSTSASGLSRAESKTASPAYREILKRHKIRMDPMGRLVPSRLQEFLRDTVLKERRLIMRNEDIDDVQKTAEAVYDRAEGVVTDMLSTPMFRLVRDELEKGANSQWTTEPLPPNPHYSRRLVAPKADAYFGYGSIFKDEEMDVIEHNRMAAYTKPTPYNILPFLIFEVKADASGGTLWVAENQAAGAGSHSVRSLRTLLEEAQKNSRSSQAPDLLDTLAYSITLNARQANLWIHYYHSDEYVMSYVDTYMYAKRGHVSKFRNDMENIVNHCLGPRLSTIKNALGSLYPTPAEWGLLASSSDVTIDQLQDEDSPLTEHTLEEQGRAKRTRVPSDRPAP